MCEKGPVENLESYSIVMWSAWRQRNYHIFKDRMLGNPAHVTLACGGQFIQM